MQFELESDYQPTGDQPEAIRQLVSGLNNGIHQQTLLGVTGSGKTFTVANVIAQVQRPTLILSHNKTLAAQLYGEFKQFFPNNAVEYFVSYYDYYQPEAYIPSTGTFIEKDLQINDEIEKLRLAATSALLSGRRDVIVVASVSCIYGIGNPTEFKNSILHLKVGDIVVRNTFLFRLVENLYQRAGTDFERGQFRVSGDTVDIFLAYADYALRISFWGDEIEKIAAIDPETGKQLEVFQQIDIFPANLFVSSPENTRQAIIQIQDDLVLQVENFKAEGKHEEAKRLEERVNYDLEMIRELGYCSGIENYSRYFDRRQPGERPFCLLDYFPEDFLMVIDESHVAVPQLHGQFAGDRSRKNILVDHGFRLPSARDNRPLHFEEVIERVNQCVFLSATPSPYELGISSQVVEQIVRPTGLVDPEVIIKPTKGQIDDLMDQVNKRVTMGDRVLVTTLTKKMAEDLTEYLLEQGMRVRYLHSNIDTIQRIEILRALRLGEFDVLVGINLLREGLDLPEVSLVAILDADKEGFLRSETSLIQMIGRAARNVDGQVVMYADRVTPSMEKAISETNRRRKLQVSYNLEHGINPQTIRKAVSDILALLHIGGDDSAPVPGKDRRRQKERDKVKSELRTLPQQELSRLVITLEQEMHEAAADLKFEYAARLRDEINELRRQIKDAG